MILPVSEQQLANLNYFRSLDDKDLLYRLKEAERIWFRLLMSNGPEDLPTIAFWEHNRDDLELVAKERNLILIRS